MGGPAQGPQVTYAARDGGEGIASPVSQSGPRASRARASVLAGQGQ